VVLLYIFNTGNTVNMLIFDPTIVNTAPSSKKGVMAFISDCILVFVSMNAPNGCIGAVPMLNPFTADGDENEVQSRHQSVGVSSASTPAVAIDAGGLPISALTSFMILPVFDHVP
jgi:hypothetical protein